MLERQVVIPASPDQLWDALTEPAAVSAWFGSRVDWDLRPGGVARFHDDDDGAARRGVIDAVLPGRRLSFRWWREGDHEDGVSEVTYHLEPDEGGTRLTVTERALPQPRPPASARVAGATLDAQAGGAWTAWDSRLVGCWARAAAPSLVGRAIS